MKWDYEPIPFEDWLKNNPDIEPTDFCSYCDGAGKRFNLECECPECGDEHVVSEVECYHCGSTGLVDNPEAIREYEEQCRLDRQRWEKEMTR